ncbi:FtsW/RodA/SpoVE family cell cycle protein [Schleiferia thermophila]|jgi:cell division protein FtsW|uniref:Probable peptidoglycan glycosyltransferase FtsW n=1 Tax=Schleiferia thermophila TaxID=884107 RepID=A0A369A655_9FLAO|nr:FtsW/RodA/SpoVE family cell cycle protein [Schleiferia thermophila]KFD38787.1 cell division protein FtsW [Schleiferia thermophila str. Yellowstone]PMB31345.1 cell division protein FtsW [Fischerella thermalis CCMEE 5319]RCX04749.1 cell division protein FtsW [Schleiferia thermophila]GCD79722.1 cell division protein FtsW [Schleiferia thermophila]
MISFNRLKLKGDKVIWIVVFLLSIFSFLSIYSAGSNLQWNNKITALSLLLRHAMHIVMGWLIIWMLHTIHYRYFAPISVLLILPAIVLLIYTLSQGYTIGNANASRWIQIPMLGITLQSSVIAGLILLVYLSRTLSKKEDPKDWNLKSAIAQVFAPVFLVVGLVFPANFSTAALIFIQCILLMMISPFPGRYVVSLIGFGVVSFGLFVSAVVTFPELMPNRVDTWKSRIENFVSGDAEESYQVQRSKMAIANGGLIGTGPGKSTQKYFLPQSSSDFIFSIVTEEYGFVGAFILLFLYFVLLIRFLLIATRSRSVFGSLLVVSAGFGIVIQALINVGVAVNLLPVTGQTLPLISAGGSSIWTTCAAIGIVQSVSRFSSDEAEEEGSEQPHSTIAISNDDANEREEVPA